MCEQENQPDYLFVCDLGEPSCFACGYYCQGWDAPVNIETRWNKSTLQCAHIIAKSQGGGNADPGNYVLLCAPCHRDAPMTLNPEDMLHWCKCRDSYLSQRAFGIVNALKSLNILDTLEQLSSSEQQDIIRKALVQVGYDSSQHATASSIAYALRGELNEIRVD